MAKTPDTGDLHPRRYPQHPDPAKGQVHGGECNRTACRRQRAVWWNTATYGFYCADCARGINIPDAVICAPVKQKPALEQMDDPAWKREILDAFHQGAG